jgi:hypothetical protein
MEGPRGQITPHRISGIGSHLNTRKFSPHDFEKCLQIDLIEIASAVYTCNKLCWRAKCSKSEIMPSDAV